MTPSTKPTPIKGWWVDIIVEHLNNRFFGELEVEIFSGRVMNVKATEVLNSHDQGRMKQDDPDISPWWLDYLSKATGQSYSGFVKMNVKDGVVTVMKIARVYTKSSRGVQLCRMR